MSEDYSAQQPTALWNPARGVWEIPTVNILCEHWGLFSETFPTSGMMRDGQLFPLQVQAHHTDENVSLLLRTPVASEAEGGAMHPNDAKAGGNTLKLGWQLLAHEGHLHPKLPTPTVVDLGNNKTIDEWETWTYEQRAKHGNGNGHGASLSIEAQKLLPTPNTMDMLPARTGEARERQLKRGDPNGKPRTSSGNLRESVVNDLLPTPLTIESRHGDYPSSWNRNSPPLATLVHSTSWGKFEPAIRQWEIITGNTAPAPTIPDGRDNQHRLNPAFAEWMMGLQPGHITNCDITRNEQLKACGNGVVPQQATLAITQLMQGLTL